MPSLGAPANEVQGTLSATFTRGTDTNIALQTGEGAAFPAGPAVVRLTYENHWCLLIYSSKSADTLVMASATDYALANNVSSGDDTYTWPAGSTVELVAAADYIQQLLNEDVDWTQDRNANGFNLNSLGGLVSQAGADIKVEMAIPTGVTAAASTAAGTLAAGTYYYRVTALDGVGETIGSAEVSATIDGTTNTAVDISWDAVPGAASYRVYGRASGAQDQYWETAGTSYTDDGSAGTAGTVPAATTAYVNRIVASGGSWFLGGNVSVGKTGSQYKFDVDGSLSALSGSFDINVELLSADKTLNPQTDAQYQWLDPNGANRVVALSTATALAGDRFVIRNDGDRSTSYYLQIKQDENILGYIYAQSIRTYIFDGTNWVAGDGVTGVSSDDNVALGYNANGYNNGTAIGSSAKAYSSGTSVGRNANAYSYGAAVGYYANAYNSGAAVGYSANSSLSGAAIGYYAHGNIDGAAIGSHANAYSYGAAVGSNAYGYYNGAAVGSSAKGFYNGASFGSEAGFNLTTYADPNKNVLLGYRAGYNLTQPPAWAASTAYSVGDFVRPSTSNGYNYEVTVAGTSGTTEPTWPTTIGDTVVDGTVTWKCVSMRGNNNIIIGYDIEASANDADTLNIGNLIYGTGLGTSEAKIGIRTSAPAETMHAIGRGYFTEGVRVRGDINDYGGGFSNYTPPTGYEGLIILAADTNATAPGHRLYAYVNGAWHYVDLT